MSNIKNQIYVKENAISTSECDNLLEGFHKMSWLHAPGRIGDGNDADKVKKSTDLTLGWEMIRHHKDFASMHQALHDGFTEYIDEVDYIVEHQPPVIIENFFNMQWYKPGEGYYAYHAELQPGAPNSSSMRCAAWMFNLNTIENGGGTEFKYFDDKIEPKAGQLSIFPAYFTHTHRGIVAPEEDKYIATGWFCYHIERY